MTRPKDKQQAQPDFILEFHKRAIGEQMVRVSFLPVEARRKHFGIKALKQKFSE